MKRILKLFTALVLVIALGALTAVIVVRLTVTREGVVVPDLIGKDLVAALELSNKQGLSLKVADRAFSTSTPTNQIISQDPRPGSWMRPEAIIRVVISKGVGEVAIPAVHGVSWRDAKSTLERYGLRVGEIYRVHSARVATRQRHRPKSPGGFKGHEGRDCHLAGQRWALGSELCHARFPGSVSGHR